MGRMVLKIMFYILALVVSFTEGAARRKSEIEGMLVASCSWLSLSNSHKTSLSLL